MDNLDKIDRKLLGYLDYNSRIPETNLAKKIGKSKESVRYRIKRLIENKIITGFITVINPYSSGLKLFSIFLNLKYNEEKNQHLVEKIRKQDYVYWIGHTDGSWNLGLIIIAQNEKDFYNKFNNLIKNYEDQIIEKEVRIILDITVLNKSFLSAHPSYIYTLEPIKYFLDEKDKKILNAIINNSRLSLIEISKLTNFNTAFIKSRLKKLENEKVIYYSIGIDRKVLDFMSYRLLLGFKENSDIIFRKIKSFSRANTNILHIIRTICKWDYEIVIVAKNYDEYNSIIEDFKRKFKENLSSIETTIIKRTEVFPAGILI